MKKHLRISGCVFLALVSILLASCGGRRIAAVAGKNELACMAPDFHAMPMEQATRTLTISFTGDMNVASEVRTAGLGFNRMADEVPPQYFLEKVAPVFHADDFTVVDVENVFSDTAFARADKGDESAAYWYRSASKNAAVLSSSGVDIASIANNHTMDFGTAGYEDTKTALSAAGITWGDESRPVYLEKYGFKIGIFCCKMFNAGQYRLIVDWLQTAVTETDYQIVYFHGGTERVFQPDAWKVRYCHELIDLGADLVVGDHPHVLQPTEQYNGGYIVYSLGNFLFGGSRTCERETIIYQQILILDQGKLAAQRANMIPVYCYTDTVEHPYQPDFVTEAAEKQVILDFMAGLTDSPETGVKP